MILLQSEIEILEIYEQLNHENYALGELPKRTEPHKTPNNHLTQRQRVMTNEELIKSQGWKDSYLTISNEWGLEKVKVDTEK